MKFRLYSVETLLIPAITLLVVISLLEIHMFMLLGGGGYSHLIAMIGLVLSVSSLLFCLYALARQKEIDRSMCTFFTLFFGGCICIFIKFFSVTGFPILLRLLWLPLLLFSLFFLFRHKLPNKFRKNKDGKI
jgi:energy-converting hydrogenase Eha subunit C